MGITIRIVGVSREDCLAGVKELESLYEADGLFLMYEPVFNPEPLFGYQECLLHFHA
jgi:hypothetical protein